MKLQPIITSLLETDLYKFSMGQAIYHQFPTYKTTWTFRCRNKDVKFTKEMVNEIREQIQYYCFLRFTEDELNYLGKIKWFKEAYIDFLRIWKPRFEDFIISTEPIVHEDDDEYDEEDPIEQYDCGLYIETRGTWLNTSMYEIPTLAIVNEVYFRMNYDYNELFDSFKSRLDVKFNKVANNEFMLGTFSEFGLRRRLSAEAQELAVKTFTELPKLKTISGFNNITVAPPVVCDSTFVGTSNVYLAKKFGITPVGTMAHEWIMCVGQGDHSHNPAYSNKFALDAWIREYGVLNGIALTDTITTDCFLRDFDLTKATLFSGVRHDSGDPFAWGEKMIGAYNNLGLDPKTKTLLFSDSLNFEKADKIYRYFAGKAKVAFGIGTYIANDTNVPALNIVMKTTFCNGQDVAKISDVAGKGMCKNPKYVDYLQRCIDWRLTHEN